MLLGVLRDIRSLYALAKLPRRPIPDTCEFADGRHAAIICAVRGDEMK